MPGLLHQASTPEALGESPCKKPAADLATGFDGGSYRDRTDDIHGVSVALYQLS